MKDLILAIDQGTTGTTCLLVDAKTFALIDSANQEYPQHFPTSGQVEHDLEEIWNSLLQAFEKLKKKSPFDPNQIQGIGITNQRETICAFDRKGVPLARAIVWQDRRTSQWCQNNQAHYNQKFKAQTGMPLDPYFSGSKIQWLFENHPTIKKLKNSPDLLFGTIDSYLLYRLSGHEAHATEPSNASRTLLVNLKTGEYDQGLLDFFGVRKVHLPKIQNSFGLFAKTKNTGFLPDGIPITGILGDQQSALFGQGCIQKGQMKTTYGTGAFALMNTESPFIHSKHGLLSTIAYGHQNKIQYALEGASYIAGAAVQWLRDKLSLVQKSSEIEALALQIKDLAECQDVLFAPFFSGIGSPHWLPGAKASILGLSRDTGKPHLARAALEGVALSVGDLISAFEADLGGTLNDIKVDGGMVANNLFLQIQSDILQKKILRPKVIETTGLGAALAAAVGLGLIPLAQVAHSLSIEREFTPDSKNFSYYAKKKKLWNRWIEFEKAH